MKRRPEKGTIWGTQADARESVRHARAALAYGLDDATALAVATIPLLALGHDFEAASGAIARALSLNVSCCGTGGSNG